VKIYLNGKIREDKEAGDVLQPGFLFGWGVFETLRIYKGKPAFLSEHIKRLKAGCKKILLQFPRVGFKEKIQALLKENRLKDAHCRITVFKKDSGVGVLIKVSPFNRYKHSDYIKGFKAEISPFVKNSRDLLVSIKSISYLPNILARRIAEQKGRQESLFLNESGFLSEGSRSNLFFVKRNAVYTPSVDCGILNGITRQKVIKIVKAQNLRLSSGKFRLKDLLSADEAFITSSLMEIMPLVEIEGKPINSGRPGGITFKLHKAYRQLVN
jgi:branched-subunit amino acid aminotransferase/4-amino-4-deoxychorismate lyase